MLGLSYLYYPWGFLVQIIALVHHPDAQSNLYRSGDNQLVSIVQGNLEDGWRITGFHPSELVAYALLSSP